MSANAVSCSASGQAQGGDRSVTSTGRRLAREVVVAPILVWNRLISPALPPRCKYEPSCSRYAIEAVREFGIIQGLVLAGWRLLRCNPWSHGGFDPVADQRVFRPRPVGRA